MFLSFERHGSRLVAGGVWEPGGVEFTPTVALTGQPLRLRLPAGHRSLDDLKLTQWLDRERVVLVGNDSHGAVLLVCRLSTGSCRLAVRIADDIYTAPGPVVSHG
jgi:hypothetical protein